MTDREKAVVMAYTGIVMLAEDRLEVYYKYIEGLLGQPVMTHELALGSTMDKIKAAAREDFIALCQEDGSPVAAGIGGTRGAHGHRTWWYQCGVCGCPVDYGDHYCRRCGRGIRWQERQTTLDSEKGRGTG